MTIQFSSKISKLEEKEPFTKTELRKFDRQTQFFIRGIQLTDNKTKKEAIDFYHEYKTTMPKHKRQIYSKKVHETITKDYPNRTKIGNNGKREVLTKEVNEDENFDDTNEDNFEDDEDDYDDFTNEDNYEEEFEDDFEK
jgi:hypothetical protein